ncbi:probable receptor-like protein kinase At5g20050 [Prosopis cineraria]|uniref:probable receptor-like protein kinase At5g20050 n=1 Tax=Prosopis cineraria TaxID=364024 RepID=UPI0024108E22|nr:probable receptor-like protein kinase At5g20050 [Prosopis cineraria]
MEDRLVNTVSVISVIALITFVVIARCFLKRSRVFFLILGADVTLIIAVFACVLIRLRYNRRRRLIESRYKSEGRELRIEYSFLRKVAGVPTKFRFQELEDATNRFQSLLGQGASASVFKGILNDGTTVAVKRINGEERGEKEFKSEVAAIASVQHVNLVRLIGYFNSTTAPRYLVYEFIPNGSLDSWIFPFKTENRRSRRGFLSWSLRYRVAIDVAKALSYLHDDCRSTILHLDVKPENILLDENFKAVVSDFGLSKLMGKDESEVMTTVRGTRGYLAPEWLLEHGVSEKTDIYSYGMVLLEIIGGRRNVCVIQDPRDRAKKKWDYFPKTVNEKVREGKPMEIVDQTLIDSGGVEEREVKRMVYVALWCIQERPRVRPSMKQVVEMLEARAKVEEPPDTRMVTANFLSVGEEGEAESCSNGTTLADYVASQRAIGNSGYYGSTYSMATTVLSGR